MEFSWAIFSFTCLATLAFFTKSIMIKHLSPQPRRKIAPGPKPWPLIGNLDLLGSLPHKSLHLLSQKYGDIMQMKFGSSPVIIASSPEMAKQFLKIHDSKFASRPSTAGGKYTSYNYSNLGWAPYGPHLRQARKIFLTKIFTLKTLESYEHIRVTERNLFISRLYALLGKQVVIRDHLTSYTLSSICKMLSNKDANDSNPEDSRVSLEEYRDMIDQWFVLNSAFNIGDWTPWLSFLDVQGYVKEMKIFFKKMDRILNFVVDDHIAAKRNADKNFVPMDLVDILLQIAEDPDVEIKLTKDVIKGLIMDILGGARESSATPVEWAMKELLRQPRIIEKAIEELDKVVGRCRWVEEKDFSNLPYIDAIVKETFRLHPTSPLLPPHYAMEDCNVDGYDIRKGTTIVISQWSLGRNHKYWGDNFEQFLPERFLDRNINILGDNFSILPFGSGRRMCPGYPLGLKFIFTTLANLIHGFKWKLGEEGMLPKDICMDELFGFTTHPKTLLTLVIEPRLANDLYKSLS